MQHLLDFIHEHILERELYLVVAECESEAELELSFRHAPGEDSLWQVRQQHSQEPAALVHYGDLLDDLELRGADMEALERELQALITTHLAFADGVLRDAKQLLGSDVVQRTIVQQRAFALQLQAAVTHMLPPARPLRVVAGGGARTNVRTGHLSRVR